MGFIKIGSAKDLASGEMMGVDVEGVPVLVANIGGKYHAIGNKCMHMGCMISEGELKGENVICPCHGSTYNVKTGKVVKGPAKKSEPAYEVKVDDGKIFVKV